MTGKRSLSLLGHSAEISAGKFNFDGTLIVSGSMDGTMRLWEADSGTPLGSDYTLYVTHYMQIHYVSYIYDY